MDGKRSREKERTARSIYSSGNKHGAAGVDPSGYRFVYTASVCRTSRQVVARVANDSNFSPASSLLRFFATRLRISPLSPAVSCTVLDPISNQAGFRPRSSAST